jgi:hypothetical protein
VSEDTNSIVDIKKFLASPGKPVPMDEFKEFWDSCTDEEKEQFKRTELPKE